MPIKKKKGKKKGKKKPRAGSATSMVSGGSQTGGGGKKKKKRAKSTKADKAKGKLEKATDALKKSGAPFQYFLDRLDRWLIKHHKKAIQLFQKVDDSGEGVVTFSEFKSGMFDMDIPCSAIELHLLCQLLDENETEEIDYLELENGLQCVREKEAAYRAEDIRPALKTTVRELAHCPCCKMAVWNGENFHENFPRYIEVLFRLVTFDSNRNHTGHFNIVVHSHISIFNLMHLIRQRTLVQSSKLAIFTDKTREAGAMLPPEATLEECGFKGGSIDEPDELLLYYDYVVEFVDCPILLCDHYFGQKLKIF